MKHLLFLILVLAVGCSDSRSDIETVLQSELISARYYHTSDVSPSEAISSNSIDFSALDSARFVSIKPSHISNYVAELAVGSAESLSEFKGVSLLGFTFVDGKELIAIYTPSRGSFRFWEDDGFSDKYTLKDLTARKAFVTELHEWGKWLQTWSVYSSEKAKGRFQ